MKNEKRRAGAIWQTSEESINADEADKGWVGRKKLLVLCERALIPSGSSAALPSSQVLWEEKDGVVVERSWVPRWKR